MMRRFAKLACRLLYAARIWQFLLAVERTIGWRRHAVVLLYHHIRNDGETLPPLSQVEEGISESAFATQLREFCRWYKPCTPATLHAALAAGAPLMHDGLVVTFDDGYRDNRSLAGPTLRSQGIKGLVFISTGFIESQRRFWWVQLNDVVRSLTRDSLVAVRAASNGFSPLSTVLADANVEDRGRRRELRVKIAAALESLPDEERNAELEALGKAAGSPTESCLPLLTWSEMRAMRSEGFEFGAHTVNHLHMSRIPGHQLRTEISDCVETMFNKLGVRPGAFAYPYGDLNDQAVNEVREAGFEAAYAAYPGAALPGRTCRFRIPRIQLGTSDPVQITVVLVALKLSKYLPRLLRPALSRLFGEPFELGAVA